MTFHNKKLSTLQQEDHLQAISIKHEASIINFQTKPPNCNALKMNYEAVWGSCQREALLGMW